jgi:(S)-ureidoglycine aminohydrolase
MKKIISLLFLFPLFVMAQQDSLSSGIYSWKEPKKESQKNISSAILFEGKVYDMEWLQMSANELIPSKIKNIEKVPGNEEQLIIIKSGRLTLVIKDSAYSIGAGSIALLMPGEKYTLQNKGNESCNYYEMKYRSKLSINIERGKTSGGSWIKDWNKIEFKPNDKGGRRDFFERPTAMCKRFEMHVTTLNQGIKSHDPHTHRAEEIVVVVDNKTEMQIRDKFYKGNTASIYYLGSNVSHAIQNDGVGPCTYFAFQFE